MKTDRVLLLIVQSQREKKYIFSLMLKIRIVIVHIFVIIKIVKATAEIKY